MKDRFFHPLVTTVETFTPAELAMAPELLTLAALDASLLAACGALHDAFPGWTEMIYGRNERSAKVDKHLADAICILAKALRSNLSAYHAAIQEACEDETPADSVEF